MSLMSKKPPSAKSNISKLDPDVADHPYLRRYVYALSNSFANIQSEERVEFRASGLPFCAIYHAYRLRLKKAGPTLQSLGDWQEEFYTTIGTALHELWQKILVMSALESDRRMEVKVFGSWECTSCKNIKTESFYPKYPCKCGNTLHWKYRELEFIYKGLGLHIDMLEYYPRVDQWVVSDLKTAGADNVEKGNLEIEKNSFQIEAYCVILEELFDIKISKYCLWYQTRDKFNKYYPHFVDWTPERFKRAKRRLDRWTRTNKMIPDYLKKPSADNLLPMIDSRPCVDNKSYDREMRSKFKWDNHTKKACPFKDQCVSSQSSERMARNINATIEMEVDARESGQRKVTDNKSGVKPVISKTLFEKTYKKRSFKQVI